MFIPSPVVMILGTERYVAKYHRHECYVVDAVSVVASYLIAVLGINPTFILQSDKLHQDLATN